MAVFFCSFRGSKRPTSFAKISLLPRTACLSFVNADTDRTSLVKIVRHDVRRIGSVLLGAYDGVVQTAEQSRLASRLEYVSDEEKDSTKGKTIALLAEKRSEPGQKSETIATEGRIAVVGQRTQGRNCLEQVLSSYC